MKSFCHSVRIFLFTAFLGAIAVVGCKKTESLDSPNIESSVNSDIEEVEEIAIPDDNDEDQTDYSSDVASMKVESVVSSSVATQTEDQDNECQTFKYAGYNHINGEEGGKFTVTVTLPDTTDGLIDTATTNKPNLVLCGFAGLTKKTPTTYEFYAYQASGWDSLRNLKVQFIFKTKKGKTIKSKSIACIGQHVNGATFGTNEWGTEHFQEKINGFGGLAGHLTPHAPIDTSYVPTRGDIIKMTNGTKFKFGVITSNPVLVAPTRTKPKRWDFRLSEMNSRECRSTITHKKVRAYAVGNSIATNIKSVDATYSATTFKRYIP